MATGTYTALVNAQTTLAKYHVYQEGFALHHVNNSEQSLYTKIGQGVLAILKDDLALPIKAVGQMAIELPSKAAKEKKWAMKHIKAAGEEYDRVARDLAQSIRALISAGVALADDELYQVEEKLYAERVENPYGRIPEHLVAHKVRLAEIKRSLMYMWREPPLQLSVDMYPVWTAPAMDYKLVDLDIFWVQVQRIKSTLEEMQGPPTQWTPQFEWEHIHQVCRYALALLHAGHHAFQILHR